MGGEAYEVDGYLAHVEGNFADGLRGVGVEENSAVSAEGANDANLSITHDRYCLEFFL